MTKILSKIRIRLLVTFIAVAIAVSGVSALLLNTSVEASPSPYYRWSVGFGYGELWEEEMGVRVMVETLVNILNPSDAFIDLWKKFVPTRGENVIPRFGPSEWHYDFLNANWDFAIDWVDVVNMYWPSTIPRERPPNPFWCGWVVIKCERKLAVSVAYNKKAVPNYTDPTPDPTEGVGASVDVEYIEPECIIPPAPEVGGSWISVDKLALLAPYIALASTILATTAATAIYIKHRKKKFGFP